MSYKIAIISDENSWINKYIEDFVNTLLEMGHTVIHKFSFDKNKAYDMVFLLSYSQIVRKEFLELNKNNLVVHESDLPLGKGWSPLSWQILEGKNECTITLFEADEKVDAGQVYLKKVMCFTGNELVDELRQIQAAYTIDLCKSFVCDREKIIKNAYVQKGEGTYYPKRTPIDSQIDINKTIAEQFNLLRIVDNEKYPAFFFMNGEKYILNIKKGQ